MKLGTRLRSLREIRGLTLLEVERRSGVAQPNLSRIESGGSDPRWSTIERILDALQCDVSALSSAAAPSSVVPLAAVEQDARKGLETLASLGRRGSDPQARLRRKATLGEDVRDESRILADVSA